MIPETTACGLSEGRTLLGKDCQSLAVVNRINAIDKLFCDLVQQIEISQRDLTYYCGVEFVADPPAEVETEAVCPLTCPTPTMTVGYLLTVNDLDQSVYDLLALLETEVCATFQQSLVVAGLLIGPEDVIVFPSSDGPSGT